MVQSFMKIMMKITTVMMMVMTMMIDDSDDNDEDDDDASFVKLTITQIHQLMQCSDRAGLGLPTGGQGKPSQGQLCQLLHHILAEHPGDSAGGGHAHVTARPHHLGNRYPAADDNADNVIFISLNLIDADTNIVTLMLYNVCCCR